MTLMPSNSTYNIDEGKEINDPEWKIVTSNNLLSTLDTFRIFVDLKKTDIFTYSHGYLYIREHEKILNCFKKIYTYMFGHYTYKRPSVIKIKCYHHDVQNICFVDFVMKANVTFGIAEFLYDAINVWEISDSVRNVNGMKCEYSRFIKYLNQIYYVDDNGVLYNKFTMRYINKSVDHGGIYEVNYKENIVFAELYTLVYYALKHIDESKTVKISNENIIGRTSGLQGMPGILGGAKFSVDDNMVLLAKNYHFDFKILHDNNNKPFFTVYNARELNLHITKSDIINKYPEHKDIIEKTYTNEIICELI